MWPDTASESHFSQKRRIAPTDCAAQQYNIDTVAIPKTVITARSRKVRPAMLPRTKPEQAAPAQRAIMGRNRGTDDHWQPQFGGDRVHPTFGHDGGNDCDHRRTEKDNPENPAKRATAKRLDDLCDRLRLV
jgi:hypothetical protein